MARALPVLWTVVLAVGMLVGGFTVGYSVSRLSSPSANGPATSTLSVIAAGTLGVPFGSIASYVANTSDGVSAPTAAQQYEGSLLVMSAVAQLGGSFDVVAAADYRLIPANLEPDWTSWEVVFATSPEALVYDPTVAALDGMNTSNWPSKVLASGVPMGVANASTDPNGYNQIFVLELEGLLQNGSLSALYDHFFTTPVGSYAIPNPTTTRVESESNVASLISSHAVGLFITYRSYAVSHGLSYVDLDPAVGLGSTDPVNEATYAQASTTIEPAGGTQLLHGAPVLFSVTVPHNAPDAALGLAFVHVLLSPVGGSVLSADGLTPIFPGWCDRPIAVPSILAPDVVPLPSTLSDQLAP
ncbi:MAG TPA: substrate-binding domain-containing protein [Thermoplasmata archaeon]